MPYPRKLQRGNDYTRLLIFDDYTFNPLTFVRVPCSEQELYDRRMFKIAPPVTLLPREVTDDNVAQLTMDVVDIRIEPFVRRRGRVEQVSIVGFTNETRLAKLLVPEWLPGQSRAVDAILDRQEVLEEMLVRSVMGER